MKKIFFFSLPLLVCPMMLMSSCGSEVYDTHYLLNLIFKTNSTDSVELPTTQEAEKITDAQIIFNKFISENKKNEIRDELIFSCLNFITKTSYETPINEAYVLKDQDTFLSLYENKKIIMQTEISNFNYEWNSTNSFWNIFSSAITLSVQFTEDYYVNVNLTYLKGSTISYDFFPQSVKMEYVASEAESKDKFIFNKQYDFNLNKSNDENIYGVIVAKINGNNKPLKKISEIPPEKKLINNYFVNKKTTWN